MRVMEFTWKLSEPSVSTTLFGRKRVLPMRLSPLDAPLPVSLAYTVRAEAEAEKVRVPLPDKS